MWSLASSRCHVAQDRGARALFRGACSAALATGLAEWAPQTLINSLWAVATVSMRDGGGAVGGGRKRW
eukprot:15473917-Alexandrium_andersonii.AAC.1